MYRVWSFVEQYSLPLIMGALLALVWANIAPDSYHHFVEHPLLFNDVIGFTYHHWETAVGVEHAEHSGVQTEEVLTVHHLVDDVLMAFFFAIAAKEVWEAVTLEEGALRGKKAATPLFATVGGMVGPVAIYLGLAAFLGSDVYDAVWALFSFAAAIVSIVAGRLLSIEKQEVQAPVRA